MRESSPSLRRRVSLVVCIEDYTDILQVGSEAECEKGLLRSNILKTVVLTLRNKDRILCMTDALFKKATDLRVSYSKFLGRTGLHRWELMIILTSQSSTCQIC